MHARRGFQSATGLILVALLVIAFLLRLKTIAFGLPALNDPDELMFELGAVRMLGNETMNPGWFGHPATTTIYVLALADILVFAGGYVTGHIASPGHFAELVYSDPTWVILPGRIAMALFAIGTLGLLYRLTRRLFGPAAALVAVALLVVSPLHITLSQLIRSDMMASVFMLLTMFAAIGYAEKGDRRSLILAALWVGLAMATKWPFGMSALAFAGAVALRWRGGKIGVAPAIGTLAAMAALTLVFFLLTTPYIILDHQTVAKNLSGESQIKHLGATGGAPWENGWFYLRVALVNALGLPTLALALYGAWRARSERLFWWIVAPVGAAFFLVLTLQTLMWERWALPLLFPIAMLAGLGFVDILRRIARRPVAGAAGAAMLALMLVPSVLGLMSDDRERATDTRQIAADWARRNIPAGQDIMLEHFAFDMLPDPWGLYFPVGEVGCIDTRALLQGRVRYDVIDDMRNGRSNVDYGTMAPHQRGTCDPDYAILTQYERYRAERADFPVEYAAYRELLAKGRVVATVTPVKGRVGGPAITIVRFR